MSKKLEKFVSEIELSEIFLESSYVKNFDFPLSVDPEEISLLFEHTIDHIDFDEAKCLGCFVGIRTVGYKGKNKNIEDLDDIKDKDKAFEIHPTYCLMYDYSKYKNKLDLKMIEEFKGRVAMFNAHGYIREYIQSASQKMGLPSVLVPLLERG